MVQLIRGVGGALNVPPPFPFGRVLEIPRISPNWKTRKYAKLSIYAPMSAYHGNSLHQTSTKKLTHNTRRRQDYFENNERILPYFENKLHLSKIIVTVWVHRRPMLGSAQNLVSCGNFRGLGSTRAPTCHVERGVSQSAPSPHEMTQAISRGPPTAFFLDIYHLPGAARALI
jgi:hypothetical protein